MSEQGQVFKLTARGADGRPLWAYRYRLDGRVRRVLKLAPSQAAQKRRKRFGKRSHDSDRAGARRR